MKIEGCTALVTGGSRGIGRATALLLARAGADVGITFQSRVADAEQVEREMRALGRRCYLGRGDLADASVVEQVFRECRAAFGGLDLLVINSGGPPGGGLGGGAQPSWGLGAGTGGG